MSKKVRKFSTTADFAQPIDISIPLRFGNGQPNVYGVDQATSKTCRYGALIGDTRQGGTVNFEKYTVTPHCNGTHTECVGHITDQRISIRDCLKDVLLDALLISVEPENAIESGDSYPYELGPDDRFVTQESLEKAIGTGAEAVPGKGPARTDPLPLAPESLAALPSSLIIRTLPNDASKLTRQYDKPVPPFLSNEAARYVVEAGFKHLLADIPSIDRLYDDGRLSNHRIFWKVQPGSKSLNGETRKESTITELIFVHGDVRDGRYVLNLQIAPFESDAAPSRPLLFSR